jgi:hypothetical protein
MPVPFPGIREMRIRPQMCQRFPAAQTESPPFSRSASEGLPPLSIFNGPEPPASPARGFGLFAGPGVQRGQVIGKSDKIGPYPATAPESLDDIDAPVCAVLRIDPASEVRDRQGRPVRLNRGRVIQLLFTGAAE